MSSQSAESAHTCAGCSQPLREGLLSLWTCETEDCPGNLTPALERVAGMPTQCIGCGHPNPSAFHVAGCADAQRKMRQPVRFTPAPADAAPKYEVLVDEVSALLEDEDLMWRFGAIEWEIEGTISPGLRSEVIRQAREHVSNLAAALSLPPGQADPS